VSRLLASGQQPDELAVGSRRVLGTRRNRFTALIATSALAAGCGAGAYTKSDFIARADAICASSLSQARSIPSGGGLSAYLSAELPILETEANQLLKLRRPPDTARDRAILTRYFDALTQTVRDYRQLETATSQGDQDAASSIEAALAASPLESLATSYGMRACGPPTATVA
jgi:hypothetical protein